MKPRKTRIKVVTKSNGNKMYIPQHRNFFGFWYNFTDFDGYNCFVHTNAYTYCNRGSTLSNAQTQIDAYIEAFEKEEIRRKGKDIVNVEYIKYP